MSKKEKIVANNNYSPEVPDAMKMYDGYSEPLTDLNRQYGEQP